MRRITVRICNKCGKTYLQESGGIVATPADFVNSTMCNACKAKSMGKVVKNLVDYIKRKN
jgi:hypothetical protein